MRFITDLGRFADCVRDASAGLSGNPMYPVLSGMLIEVSEDVTVTAFDGNVMFIADHECLAGDGCASVLTPGKAVVPGRLFADVIRNLTGDSIEFNVKDGLAFINAGFSKFTLPTMDLESYPGGMIPGPPQGIAEGPVLAAAIAKVSPSISRVQANPAFTCVLADPEDEHLALVASDRSRMACVRVPWTRSGEGARALIPGWAAEKFAKAASGPVTLGWDSQRFSMSCEGLEVISRGIAGEHVRWREMLPERVEGVHVDASALLAAIRQASVLLGRSDPVDLRFDGDDLYVTGSGERGECESYLEVRNPGGEEIPERVRLGLGIILDGLVACGDEAVLGFSGPGKPVKLYSENFRYVMAPRRI